MTYRRLLVVPILVVVALFGGWLALNLKADSESPTSPPVYAGNAFIIQLPAGLKSTTFPRDDGQTMLVFEGRDGSEGFQVFTMPVNEPLPATEAQLKEGLPALVVDDFKNTTLDGEPAVSFFSQDTDFGNTFEVWFVHDGLLYQVMTYRRLDAWLIDILKTWRFR